MVDSCRTCENCKRGLEQYCLKSPVFTYNGEDKHSGGITLGGYSERIVVAESFVLKINPKVDLAATAPLLCAGITTYSPLRHWKVGKGQKVGVVGLAFKSNTDDLRESPMVTLVETLIGKGCAVRILDPNVVMARLRGANRQYIETEIPHVASLLCDTVQCLVDHAEVIVIGAACTESAEVLAAARPDQAIVDLTRGAIRMPGAIREEPIWAAS